MAKKLRNYRVTVYQELIRHHRVSVVARTTAEARELARDVANEYSGTWSDVAVTDDWTRDVEEVE